MDHSQTGGRFRQRRYRSHRTHHRLFNFVLPVIVCAGALYVPMAAQDLCSTWDEILVLAQHLESMEGAANEIVQKKVQDSVDKAPTLKAMQENVRQALPEQGVADIQTEFMKGKDPQEVQRTVRKLSQSVASGSYADVPQDIAQKVRSMLGPETIKKLKEKIRSMNPSPEQLEKIAMEELTRSGVSRDEAQQMMSQGH